MDLDEKLLEMCGVLGKEASYKGILKRTYNEIVKKKAEEGLTDDILAEGDFQKLILYELCNKYEIRHPEDIINSDDESIIDVEEDDDGIMKEILDIAQDPMEMEAEGLGEPVIGEDKDDWKHIFKTTPAPRKFSSDSSNKGKDFDPSFTIIDRVTYKLKVTDPSKNPVPYSGTDNWGKDFEKFIIGVTLLELSDDTLYEEVFEGGERKGELLYEKNKKYALFLNKEKGFPEFVTIFKEIGLSRPNSKPFYLKRFKQTSKKGNKYNVFKFALK